MQAMVPMHIQLETSVLRKVIKRLHYPLEIMLVRNVSMTVRHPGTLI